MLLLHGRAEASRGGWKQLHFDPKLRGSPCHSFEHVICEATDRNSPAVLFTEWRAAAWLVATTPSENWGKCYVYHTKMSRGQLRNSVGGGAAVSRIGQALSKTLSTAFWWMDHVHLCSECWVKSIRLSITALYYPVCDTCSTVMATTCETNPVTKQINCWSNWSLGIVYFRVNVSPTSSVMTSI